MFNIKIQRAYRVPKAKSIGVIHPPNRMAVDLTPILAGVDRVEEHHLAARMRGQIRMQFNLRELAHHVPLIKYAPSMGASMMLLVAMKPMIIPV